MGQYAKVPKVARKAKVTRCGFNDDTVLLFIFLCPFFFSDGDRFDEVVIHFVFLINDEIHEVVFVVVFFGSILDGDLYRVGIIDELCL